MIKRLCVLAVAMLAMSVPARAATITLDVASPVSVGSMFDVTVLVTNVFAGRPLDDVVVGFGFNVTVGNSSVAEFVDSTAGSLFFPLDLGTPMVSGIALNPLGIGPGDFSGPLTLATLHFRAIGAGSSPIGVTWDSSDLNQGLVYLDLPYGPISASTSVRAVSTVPEPATLLLVAAGLTVLGRTRR